MRLTHLSLVNFRNYRRLELDLVPGVNLFWGENAQGKTNLLEAVYLLATMRSPRTTSDADFIRWEGIEDGIGSARIAGRAERGRTDVQVEMAMMLRAPNGNSAALNGGTNQRTSKRLRVNGNVRRATEVIGQVPAVLFTTQDLDLLTGPPAGRRRYLDLTLSQADAAYLAALQRYQRAMQQRNVLLRQISERRLPADQLLPWNEELVAQGAVITRIRAQAVAYLSAQAASAHVRLSEQREQLRVRYLPSVTQGDGSGCEDETELRNRFRAEISTRERREIESGITLVGPHRDDVEFELDGHAAGAFGSRAQQRTVALALRLAEASLLEHRSGHTPILLLDDVLSELDHRRRHAVIERVEQVEQALITTAELDRFGGPFVAKSAVYTVAAGNVRRLRAEATDPLPPPAEATHSDEPPPLDG